VIAGPEPNAEDDSHVLQLYGRDADLAGYPSSYLSEGLVGGGTAVVVATEQRLREIEREITASWPGLDEARRQGRLIAITDTDPMHRLSAKSTLDSMAFRGVIGDPIAEAVEVGLPVRAFVETPFVLGRLPEAGADLEHLWDELRSSARFSLLCAYPLGRVSAAAAFDVVRRAHGGVVAGFGVDRRSPRAARHVLAATLRAWGLEPIVDDASLVVAELATNSVVHARSPFTMVVSHRHHGLRIEIFDDSPVPPELKSPAPTSPSGRGVFLIVAISRSWGWRRHGPGKVVWAELPTGP
jgi:MEDS: MEthanogen/methylotroph, DcmR Sensory domain/Histidine kinase-like ATPase domain